MKSYTNKNDLQLNVERFQREFNALNHDEAAQLAFRAAIRLLPFGVTEVPSGQGVAILRQLLTASLVIAGKVDSATLKAAAEMRVPLPIWRTPKEAIQSKFQTQQVVKALTNSDRSAAMGAVNYFLSRTGLGGMREGSVTQLDIQQIKTKETGPWPHITGQALPAVLPKTFPRVLADLPPEDREPVHHFWINWYQRTVTGAPQNWDMLRDVALIDNATWEQDGGALDRAIQRIVERHRLLEDVRRLKAELAKARSADATSPIHHRDHNQPPELVPSQPVEIAIAAQAIAAGLDEAEEELQQPQPSPARLKHIGFELRKAVMSVLAYCAGLGDEALRDAAKEVGASVGKWLGPGAVGYLIARTQTFQELADALIRLADKF